MRHFYIYSMLSFKMTDRFNRISKALNEAAIAHECYHDCIHVRLPCGFGILELKLWPDGSDSIQLINGDFHTHADILAMEYGQSSDTAFATLVSKILTSELLLIEETSPKGDKRKTIAESLEDYLRYLPEGTSYRVANKT